jgi:hypothetical protein
MGAARLELAETEVDGFTVPFEGISGNTAQHLMASVLVFYVVLNFVIYCHFLWFFGG